jgi:hypothetical protein
MPDEQMYCRAIWGKTQWWAAIAKTLASSLTVSEVQTGQGRSHSPIFSNALQESETSSYTPTPLSPSRFAYLN